MGRDSISFSPDLVLRARHSTCVGKRCDIASLAGREKLHLVVVVAGGGGEAGAWKKIQDFPPFPLATLPCRRCPFKQFSCVGTAVAPVYNKRRGGRDLFSVLCSTALFDCGGSREEEEGKSMQFKQTIKFRTNFSRVAVHATLHARYEVCTSVFFKSIEQTSSRHVLSKVFLKRDSVSAKCENFATSEFVPFLSSMSRTTPPPLPPSLCASLGPFLGKFVVRMSRILECADFSFHLSRPLVPTDSFIAPCSRSFVHRRPGSRFFFPPPKGDRGNTFSMETGPPLAVAGGRAHALEMENLGNGKFVHGKVK